MVHGLETLKRLNAEAEAGFREGRRSRLEILTILTSEAETRLKKGEPVSIPVKAALIDSLIEAHKSLLYVVTHIRVGALVDRIQTKTLPHIERALKAAGFLDVL